MKYSELSKCFNLVDGQLYKLHKSGKWHVVNNKPNHTNGYCKVCHDKKMMYYHRIVWCLSMKEDIDNSLQIGHINGDKTDNRIENMRLVTNRVNGQNWSVHRKGKLVGAKYHKKTGKWKSQIRIPKGKQVHLGTFNTEEEASKAYFDALERIRSGCFVV